jgi:hypothetical protein
METAIQQIKALARSQKMPLKIEIINDDMSGTTEPKIWLNKFWYMGKPQQSESQYMGRLNDVLELREVLSRFHFMMFLEGKQNDFFIEQFYIKDADKLPPIENDPHLLSLLD